MTSPASFWLSDERRRAVSAKAIAKSGRVMYAFAHFYLPFYGREPRDIFWEFDPFAWISAFVYDVDEELEEGCPPEEALLRLDDLAAYLSVRIALDRAVNSLFDDARCYYRFEHDVTRRGRDYTLDDLKQITAVRSFDFRLMHRTLAQRLGRSYRETLFDWFRAFEMLMEIEDDISSMEDDRRRGTFNIAYLAIRRAPDTGAEFVEELRHHVEDDLVLRGAPLSDTEQGLCGRTLESYRQIVRRPVLGTPKST